MNFSSKKFKEVRDRHGLTLKKIAEKIGVAESTVHGWEHKKYFPRAAKFNKLVELFGCSPRDLLDFDEEDQVSFMTQENLALKGFPTKDVKFSSTENLLESFRRAILNEIMLSEKIDPSSKNVAYKLILEYKMPPFSLSGEVKQ